MVVSCDISHIFQLQTLREESLIIHNVIIWLIMSFTTTCLFEQIVLIIGTKLERIITKMATELTSKTTVTIGLPDVMLSDELFWFKRPQLIIKFVHFILFQVNLYSMCMCMYTC